MTSNQPPPEPGASRRARRASQRATIPASPEVRRSGGSTTLRLSIGAVVAGILAVAVIAYLGGAGRNASAAIASPHVQIPAGLADGRYLGHPDALLTIDLWADFQCPVCLRWTDTIEPLLRASYIQTGTVRLAFHDLAFIGQESTDAAAAARVSDAIGPGFWPFHDLLYANQGSENGGAFSRDRLADMAVTLGMDRAAFLAALDDPAYAEAVKQETAVGKAAGVSSTPTLVFGTDMYPGLPTWDQLSALIEQRLATLAPSPTPSAGP